MQPSAISADYLANMLEQFLADTPQAVAVEDGEVLFDFGTTKYAVSGDGKCVLHLWSEERNAVRRVLDAEIKGRTLRLNVLRFGQAQPTLMEICGARDRRAGTLGRGCGASTSASSARSSARTSRREARASEQQSRSRTFPQSRLHARRAARRTVGLCRAWRECRGKSVLGGRGALLRHSLDGLPAPASGRARARGRAEAVSAARPLGNRAPARRAPER